MTFGLLSGFGVLLGVLTLAVGLWLMQRLRVQHQEVQVLTTLFWQAAIKETRARVFVKRFRHLPAWLLLVAIASLLWMLLSRPQTQSSDGTQHVVLLHWDDSDEAARSKALQLGLIRAATLPTNSREIIAASDQLHTLVAAGEELEIAEIRDEASFELGSTDLHWVLNSLASRSSADQPVHIHLVAGTELESDYVQALPEYVELFRVEDIAANEDIQLQTFGYSSSLEGPWNTVDVQFGFDASAELDASSISLKLNDQPLSQVATPLSKNQFGVSEIPAVGGVLQVQYRQEVLGSLSLPDRKRIGVELAEGVPEILRDLIEIDEAVEVVSSGGDVKVGFDESSDLQLTTQDSSAFVVAADSEDPQAALSAIIDELALTQIDATSLAEQSGQIVDVQVRASDRRQIAVWQSLFGSGFDFVGSRACPIFVARSIRWLANRPEEIQWAGQGERIRSDIFLRALIENSTLAGQEFKTSRLSRPVQEAQALTVSPEPTILYWLTPYTWFGILVSALLATEWILFQRGKMP
ncbi:MAG: BatA domain-containing protein [Planctomycetota bacterium]|nr:BatA domain-containing protein [Planctomycetota bacterium]